MKVINKGQDPKDIEYVFMCNHCKSTLQAPAQEGTRYSSYQGTFYTFSCPVCSREFSVDKRNMRQV